MYIISYLPPSQCFSITEELNPQGAIEAPIVLLEIILHSSSKLYRWRRADIVEQIQLADRKQEGELDLERLNWKI